MERALGHYDPRWIKSFLEKNRFRCWLDTDQIGKVGRGSRKVEESGKVEGSGKVERALGYYDPRWIKSFLEKSRFRCWLDTDQIGKVGRGSG